jgi:hypothetical protein
MSEIHDELSKLNTESDELMQAIQGLKLWVSGRRSN